MKYTPEQVARMAGKEGRATKAVYVTMIELGYARPSYSLATVLSRVTRGYVTVPSLLDYKQRRTRRARTPKLAKQA